MNNHGPESSRPSDVLWSNQTEVVPFSGLEKRSSEVRESLGRLSIVDVMHKEHIDPEAVRNLARERVDLAFDVALKYSDFAPAVASAIVHGSEHTPEVIRPTAAQIKEQSFGARFVAGFLGLFSDRLARRFDRYLEKKASQKVGSVARRARYAIDTITAVNAPKTQFVDDIARMYTDVRHNAAPLKRLVYIAEHLVGNDSEETPYKYASELAKLSGLSRKVDKLTLSAFAPEILRGIEQFLRRQEVVFEQPVEVSGHRSMVRGLVRRFAPGALRQIPNKVDSLLTNIHGILPEDGNRFRDTIYAACKSLETRTRQGENGRELTKSVLEEVKRQLR